MLSPKQPVVHGFKLWKRGMAAYVFPSLEHIAGTLVLFCFIDRNPFACVLIFNF